MRVTRDQLRAKAQAQGLQEQGANIAINWAYGRPRCTTKNEGRDISPRLSVSEMAIWLNGFQSAMLEFEDAISESVDIENALDYKHPYDRT